MASRTFQFHGESGEVVLLGGTWAAQLRFVLMVERFFPTPRLVIPDSNSLDSILDKLEGRLDRIWLSPEKLVPRQGKAGALFEAASECIAISIGHLSEQGLRESFCQLTTSDENMLRAWRGLIARARCSMHKGAWLVNPRSGAKKRAVSHYYTPGALAMFRSGIKMLAVAGTNEFILDDPPQH